MLEALSVAITQLGDTEGEVEREKNSADKASTKTTDTCSQTYTVSAGRKEDKQTVESIRSSE